VVFDDRILEKPRDAEDAESMLLSLSDAWHVVVTSFTWRHTGDDRSATRTVATDVRFRAVDEAWVKRYVATGEPMDKAGAYGVQELGGALVAEIRGSYTCVVGLPVCEVIETLEQLGGLTGFPFHD